MKGKSFKELIEVILTPFLEIFVPWLYVVLVSKLSKQIGSNLETLKNCDVEEDWDITDLAHFDKASKIGGDERKNL